MIFTARARVLGILSPLLVAAAYGMSACSDTVWEITHGTQGLHARLADFQAGTTRHAHSWDDVLADRVVCAERFSGQPITMTIDSLFRGGIWVTNDQVAVYTRSTHALHIGRWAYNEADVVAHEIGHGLSDDVPALRNPVDSLNVGGELDHASAYFRACVSYCPVSESGCRA